MLLSYSINEYGGPSRGFGEQGDKGIFSGEQRPKKKGNRETQAILGNREHRKSSFCFLVTREQGHFFEGTREQVPPWEGLSMVLRAWKHCNLSNKSSNRSDAEVVIVAEVVFRVVAVV